MAKIHGDFGDMTRYDIERDRSYIGLVCQDCSTKDAGRAVIATWRAPIVSLAEINRVAAEHETSEEQPQ